MPAFAWCSRRRQFCNSMLGEVSHRYKLFRKVSYQLSSSHAGRNTNAWPRMDSKANGRKVVIVWFQHKASFKYPETNFS
jgi:hypothetical protein